MQLNSTSTRWRAGGPGFVHTGTEPTVGCVVHSGGDRAIVTMSTPANELSLPGLILESQRLRQEFDQNVAQLRLTLQRTKIVAAEPAWAETVGWYQTPNTEN